MKVSRKSVARADRIKVTEKFLASCRLESVLELGAGDYSFDYMLQQCDTPGRWVKVDFAEPCDVKCDLNVPRITLPFESDTFDTIICTQVLEHLLWPQAVLAECFRMMKCGGYVVVSVPNIVSLTYRLRWLHGSLPSCAASGNLPKELAVLPYEQEDGTPVGGHVIDFDLKRIASLLEHCGFRIEKVRGCGIFWRRQLMPHWLVPTQLSSAIILLGRKD